MEKKYRRLALFLVLCLMIGLLPGMGKTTAGSKVKVKLVITDTYVTGKTYPLKQGKHRQIQVRIQNAKGNASLKFKSKDPSIAGVTRKGYVEARSLGTTKINVKVSMFNGKKNYTKKAWVKIQVVEPDATPEPTAPVDPTVTFQPTPTPDTVFPAGSLKAFLQINGSAQGTFEMSILDSAAGRKFYSSLPKVLYMTDQNRVSKVATDPELIFDMEEYKPGTLTAGDFMLYGTNKYELVYGEHRTGYAYTRIGKVLNASKMASMLGTGAVSISIVRGSLPTMGPTGSPKPTIAPAPWGTGTPWPWATHVPSGSAVTAAPGSISPAPVTSLSPVVTVPPSTSASPGSVTAPPGPVNPGTASGRKFRISINGNVFDFLLNEQNPAAQAMYSALGSGTWELEFRPNSSEGRYYAPLPAGQVFNDDTTPPPVWSAGNLMLMGNNEISVQGSTISIPAGRRCTRLGTLDTSEEISPSELVRYWFSGDPTSASIRAIST